MTLKTWRNGLEADQGDVYVYHGLVPVHHDMFSVGMACAFYEVKMLNKFMHVHDRWQW